MKRRHDYSQNFLRDPKLVKRLLARTSIYPGDLVYDIGAGSGIITSALAEHQCRVVAIEVEPSTINILRRNTAKLPNVKIIEADFMNIELPDQPYKIFSNIPFHLSSKIIQKITSSTSPLAVAYLVVQRQFANKLLPDYSGTSSQLGMIIGPAFSVRTRYSFKRTDFWPHPNVDTVLIEIQPREAPLIKPELMAAYQQFITESFSRPSFFATLDVPRRSINPSVKPSDLSLSEWLALFMSKNA